MTYAVLAPKKINQEVKVTVDFITDDIEAAKRVAKQVKSKHEAKGYQAWAKKVKIVAPKTPQGFIELATQALEVGQYMDWTSQGNSFRGQEFINWANTLRIRADQLANPEAYAD